MTILFSSSGETQFRLKYVLLSRGLGRLHLFVSSITQHDIFCTFFCVQILQFHQVCVCARLQLVCLFVWMGLNLLLDRIQGQLAQIEGHWQRENYFCSPILCDIFPLLPCVTVPPRLVCLHLFFLQLTVQRGMCAVCSVSVRAMETWKRGRSFQPSPSLTVLPTTSMASWLPLVTCRLRSLFTFIVAFYKPVWIVTVYYFFSVCNQSSYRYTDIIYSSTQYLLIKKKNKILRNNNMNKQTTITSQN